MSEQSPSESSPSSQPNPFAFESDYFPEEQHQEPNEDVPELKLSKEDRVRLLARGYETGKLITKGNVGQVYHASCYKMACVVKSFDDKEDVRLDELYMLKRLKHPHIVQLFDLYVTGDQGLLIFLELLEGGSMEDYLEQLKKSNRFLNEKQVRHYYLQFGDALRYIHGLGFAHCDLCEGNILLDGTKQVCKVSDFGEGNRIYDEATGVINDTDLQKTDIKYVEYILKEMLKGNTNLSWQVEQLILVHHEAHNIETTFDKILSTEPWFKMVL